MKERILWMGLSAVIISWLGNYFYFHSKQLEQPIFLDHFYETTLLHDNLTFYYLTNKTDQSEIHYVLVDGVEAYPISTDAYVWDTSNTPRYEQEFNHHYLKSVSLHIPTIDIPVKEGTDDVWSFKEITAVFSDGKTVTANIGEVHIVGEHLIEDAFESRASSSSSNHRHTESMIASHDLVVENMVIPFAEEVADDIYMKIDSNQEQLKELNSLQNNGGHPPLWYEDQLNLSWKELSGVPISDEIFPFHLNKNEWLQLATQVNQEQTRYLDFGVKIIGTTDSGKPFTKRSYLNAQPYFTQKKINEIIAEKQGGQTP